MTITWGLDAPAASYARMEAVRVPVLFPYVTGTPDIAWTPQQIRHFAAAGSKIIRINQGYHSPSVFDGDEFDLEAGAWTIDGVVGAVAARRTRQCSTRVYCTWANYGPLKQRLAEAGTGRPVFFRIAGWNLDQHLAGAELHGDVYAGQWASPASSPRTVIPGTSLTLTAATADLNVVLTGDTGW